MNLDNTCLKQILTVIAKANYKIITAVQCILQSISESGLNALSWCLFILLSTSNGSMNSLKV